MLKIGDTVKVIGKTLDGSGEEKELIPIGTKRTYGMGKG